MDLLEKTLALASIGGPSGYAARWVTAPALFAVTVTLAWRLAVLSHQAWPPVLISILLGVPTLYVAWLAVPGVMGVTKRAPHGRLAGSSDPVDLGVHQVIGGGPIPAYVRRPHDELLRAVLDPAVPASRLVVVRGGSSADATATARITANEITGLVSRTGLVSPGSTSATGCGCAVRAGRPDDAGVGDRER